MVYLIMELVDATTPADNAYKMVADAIQWLRNVPAPAGAKNGSVGCGPTRYKLFKDSEAPLLFASNEALHNYMNVALRWVRRPRKPTKMSFSNDKLVFTQSDMNKRNFVINKNDKICIFDFENVVLPLELFVSYTMNVSNDPFVHEWLGP